MFQDETFWCWVTPTITKKAFAFILFCFFYTAGTRCNNGDSGSFAVARKHRSETVLFKNHVGYAGLCERKAQCTLGKLDHNINCQNKMKWIFSNREKKSCSKAVFLLLSHKKELCNEMESKLHAYTDVKNAIHRMLESSDVVRGSSTEHSLSILEQKWVSVYSKVQERKVI